MGIFGKQIGNPTASGVGLPVGTRVYRALLTQTGTNAPVATVLENTLGGTVVWTRDSTGIYIGTLLGAFPSNKTFGFASGAAFVFGAFTCTTCRYTDDSVQVTVQAVGVLTDNCQQASVQVTVYP